MKPTTINCRILWRDSHKGEDVAISLRPWNGLASRADEEIFYYCESEDDFYNRLCKQDNGEDFIVKYYEQTIDFED